MKKIFFLCFSFLGMITAANASWLRWQPSSSGPGKSMTGSPTSIITCYNFRAPRCMEYDGPGNSPQAGQRVKLYNDNYEMIGYGRILNCVADPGTDGSNIDDLKGASTIVELAPENGEPLSN